VRVNENLRPSRLLKNIPSYIKKQVFTIIRIFVVYKPFRFFATIGIGIFTVGFFIGLRFLWKFLGGEGAGHVQSLIFASVLMTIGFQTILVAFLADLIAANRKLLEDLRLRIRQDNKI
jgi:hypothetical protein